MKWSYNEPRAVKSEKFHEVMHAEYDFYFLLWPLQLCCVLYKQREIKEKMLQQFMIGFESNYANSHSSMKHFSLASSQLAQLSMAMSWVSKVWAPHLIIEANNKMLLNLL